MPDGFTEERLGFVHFWKVEGGKEKEAISGRGEGWEFVQLFTELVNATVNGNSQSPLRMGVGLALTADDVHAVHGAG